MATGCTPRSYRRSKRHAEAIQTIRRAQQLDPLSLLINAEAAWDLYMARDFQAATEQAWRTLAMEPRFAPAQHALGLAYQQMGMLEEAIVEFQNAQDLFGESSGGRAALAFAYAQAGERCQAESLLLELERRSENRHVSAYWVALVHAGLGDCGTAIKWLKQAQDDRDVWLIWLRAEPRFDPVRQASGLSLWQAGGLPTARMVLPRLDRRNHEIQHHSCSDALDSFGVCAVLVYNTLSLHQGRGTRQHISPAG